MSAPPFPPDPGRIGALAARSLARSSHMIFRFANPWMAVLVVPLAAGLVLALRRLPPALLVSQLATFRTAFPARPLGHPVHIPLYLYAAAMLLAIVALMRPQFGNERLIERREGIDIVLILDVSGSMQCYDAAGVSERDVAAAINAGRLKPRIEVAKEELRKFVESRPNDRLGLIAFSRLPYMVCPPTLDHDFLLNHLATLEAGMLTDGTGIATPIASATTRLQTSSAKRRVAVLFTDGMNNVQASITPQQAADIAKTFSIAVYTVGIGSESAWVAPRGFLQRIPPGEGVDEELLRSIAAKTGARYFAARDRESFAKVMKEIDALETTTLEAPRYLDYREQFMPLLTAALVLLLVAFLLENAWLQTVP
ncbi:MAG: VWA domain-containing protein [Phycisphaeraceae bacterium]|nr:VWA domain-containing protein [Phycisphaeraceae bacterium]